MNDDFLSGFRKSPRPEFAQTLYAKLPHALPARHPGARRLALAAAAVCLAFALAFAASPDVRAAVEGILAKITVRGTTIFVNEEIPEQMRTGEGESYSEIWTPASPDEIAADHPFFAAFPTWIPRGYKLQNEAALYYASMYQEEPSHSLVQWKNARGDTIQLDINKGSCPGGPSPDSTGLGPDCTYASYISLGLESEPQVVAISGQPAILFRGVIGLADLSGTVRKWNPSRGSWDANPEAGLSLTWEDDGRRFLLVISSKKIREEDAIRMAESIP